LEQLIAIVGIIFGNITFGLLILAFWKVRTRKLELQAEVQSKLIERFGSTPELVEFLQSPAGREFVNGVQTGAVAVGRDRVLSGIRRAVILTFLGLAFVAIWAVTGREGFSFPAIILLALGIGNLAATVVTMSVGRRLGLTDEPARNV
jgi:hypothetical protein